MNDKVIICCNVTCDERFRCAKFSRALDVNAGKITGNYDLTGKCEFER